MNPPLGGLDNVTDADSGAVTGIALTDADSTNGTWWYSTTVVPLWTAIAPNILANNNALLLPADANTRIYFQPDADFNGTVVDAIKFKAWDQAEGRPVASFADTVPTSSENAFSQANDKADITVTSVNDAPAGTDKTVTTPEDIDYTFTVADFGFTDASDAPDNFLSVTITTTSTVGTLYNNGVAMNDGDSISVADINLNKLVFKPVDNAFGTSYDSFTFQVRDDGGVANSGVDLDQSANRMTISVTGVNDTPERTNGAVNNLTVAEDSGTTSLGFGTLAYGPGGGSDESGQSLTYNVTVIPAAGLGTVRLADNTAVSTGSYSLADIQGMKFEAAADGAGSGTFTFTVTDNGTTDAVADPQILTESLTITVTEINDAPQRTAGAVNDLTVAEDSGTTSLGFGTLVYGPGGGSDESGQSLTYNVTVIPAAGLGTVRLADNTAVSTGSYSLADIQGMKFETAADAFGSGTFTFTVTDNGTTDAVADPKVLTESLTITVTPVNDAPKLTAPSPPLDYTEMDPATILDELATVVDIDSNDLENGILTIGFSTGGTTNDILSVKPGNTVTLSGTDILVSGTVVGTFSGGGSGSDLVIIFNINSTPDNVQKVIRQIAYNNTSAAPATSNRVVDFVLTDGDGKTSNTVQQVINFTDYNNAPIITLPGTANDFTENDPPIQIDPSATASDVDSLNFDTGTLTVSITVNGTVNDSLSIEAGGNVTISGTNVLVSGATIGTFSGGSSGSDLVITWNSLAIPSKVQEVLRQVSFSNSSVAPDTSSRTVSFTLTDGDGGTSATEEQLVNIIAINSTPTTSGLADVSVDEDAPDTVINLSTAFSDIDNPILTYTVQNNNNPGLVTTSAAGSSLTLGYAANRNGSADITVRATDAGGLFVEDTFTVTVKPVNDQPTTTGLADVSVDEDAPNTVIELYKAFIDVEDASLTYTVTGNTNTDLVTTAVAGSNLTLAYAEGLSGIADITVRATDSLGLFVEDTLRVTVNSVNDPPTTTGLADVTVDEDAPDTLINLSNSFTDSDDPTLTYTVTANSNSALVGATVSGNGLTLDYGADKNGAANITVRATDSGGLYVEDSFTVTVNPVHDAPTAVNLNSPETYTEDTPLNLIDITVSDPDGGNVTATLTLSNPAAGVLSTATSGGITATYDADTGIWRASGPVHSVNSLLAQATFIPAPESFENFSITVRVDDGITTPLTGVKPITGMPVGDTPRVDDITTDRLTQSGLIKITPNENDGAEITHFRVSGIHGGTLFLADGTTQINDGEYITVAQGQAGVRFTPLRTAEDTDGGFLVHSSQDGATVAAQSDAAACLVTVNEIEINPNEIDDGTSNPPLGNDNNDTTSDDSDQTPAEENTEPEPGETEQIIDENAGSREEGDFNDTAGQQQSVETSPLKIGIIPPSINFRPLEMSSLSPDFFQADPESGESFRDNLLRDSAKIVKKDVPREIVWGVDYKMTSILLNNTFDAMEQEAARDAVLEKTFIGSTIAATTSLSVGYVVWLLRSGMLLSSLLSSLPAWQIADPLPILTKLRAEDDAEDESIEEIIGDDDTGMDEETENRDDDKKDMDNLS